VGTIQVTGGSYWTPKHWVYLASTPDVSNYYIIDDQQAGIGDRVCLTGSRGAPPVGDQLRHRQDAPGRGQVPGAGQGRLRHLRGTAAGHTSLDTSPMASTRAAPSNASLTSGMSSTSPMSRLPRR
jgi:hypothetical protein